MDSGELEERRRLLEERLSQVKASPLLAIRLDVLLKLMSRLSKDPELKGLFGGPVLSHLALVWDKANDDILIADANIDEIENLDEVKFLKLLHEVVDELGGV